MSNLRLVAGATPSTPAAGKGAVYVDSVTKSLSFKNDAGLVRSIGPINFSTASQAPTAASRTYITGSRLDIPTNKLQIGTLLRWRFNITKTAAGVAASTYAICFGTNGSTLDTDRVSFTKPAGTAVADEGWIEINATIRSIGASGVCVGTFRMIHNLSATGHATIPCVVVTTISAGFDMTVVNLIAGLTVTTGAADAITIQHVQAEAINL